MTEKNKGEIKRLDKRIKELEAINKELLDKIYAIPTQYRRGLKANKAMRTISNLTQQEAQALLDDPEMWILPKQLLPEI